MDLPYIALCIGLIAIIWIALPFSIIYCLMLFRGIGRDFSDGVSQNPAEHSGDPEVIIHFVTGGFSGATKVALELTKGLQNNQGFRSVLVLRRKRSTDFDRVRAAREQGIEVVLVPGWAHLATIFSMVAVLRHYRPQVMLCHGFSEHLWGRYAGLLAGVPHIVQVEHNSRERYTAWRLFQARWLSQHTDKIVGVSEGVRQNLLRLKFPEEKTIYINNGINLSPFKLWDGMEFNDRGPNIVMAARFAKQKDHLTLIRAIALLADRGLTPKVYLAGTAKNRHASKARKLVREMNLVDQIQFLGFCKKVPELLLSNQICVLSTHYEGMPLSLSEGMAAGCAVIGSSVTGVKEMINHEQDGLLVDAKSAGALADGIERLLGESGLAKKLGSVARDRAVRELSTEAMVARYEDLISSLLDRKV